MQSQSHGRIVRKLSKRLKVGSRTRQHTHTHSDHHSDFRQVRAPSPVLISSNPVPLHMQSLLEEDRESTSSTSSEYYSEQRLSGVVIIIVEPLYSQTPPTNED